MLATNDPHEAYRRSAFDARVQGGDTAALVQLCLEQAITGIGSALLAYERNDSGLRSRALTKALTAITALDMGVDRTAPLADALLKRQVPFLFLSGYIAGDLPLRFATQCRVSKPYDPARLIDEILKLNPHS